MVTSTRQLARTSRSRGKLLATIGSVGAALLLALGLGTAMQGRPAAAATAARSPASSPPELAVPALYKLLLQNPSSASNYYELGRAFQALGRPELAASAFQKALKLQPEHRATLQALARLLLDRGEPDAAARQSAELRRLEPDSAAGAELEGRAAAQRAAQVARQCLLILARSPEEALSSSIVQDVACGRFRQASQALGAIVEATEDAELSKLPDLLATAEGELARAEELLDEAARKDPNRADAQALLAELATEQGRIEEAMKQWLSLPQGDPRRDLILARLRVLQAAENEPGSADVLVADLEPRSAELAAHLAQLRLIGGDSEQALREAALANALSLWGADSHYASGLLQLRARLWASAVSELAAAAKNSPERAAFRAALAEALLASEQPERALPELAEAARTHPDSTALRLLLARAHLQEASRLQQQEAPRTSRLPQAYAQVATGSARQHFAGAESEARQILAIDPGHFPAARIVALCLAETGRSREAREQYEQLIASAASLPAERFDLAGPLLTGRALSGAIAMLEREERQLARGAVRPYRARTLDVRNTLAFGYVLAGQPGKATSLFQRELGSYPGYLFAHLELGRIQALSGKIELARKTLQQGLSVAESLNRAAHPEGVQSPAPGAFPGLRRGARPQFPTADFRVALAALHQLQGQYTEAARLYNLALQDEPEDREASLGLAESLAAARLLERPEQRVALVPVLVEVAARLQPTKNALEAREQAEHDPAGTAAELLVRAAIEARAARPDQAAPLVVQARAHWAQRDLRSAVATFQQAFDLEPNYEPAYQAFVAVLLKVRSDVSRLVNLSTTAARTGPGSPEAEDAQALGQQIATLLSQQELVIRGLQERAGRHPDLAVLLGLPNLITLPLIPPHERPDTLAGSARALDEAVELAPASAYIRLARAGLSFALAQPEQIVATVESVEELRSEFKRTYADLLNHAMELPENQRYQLQLRLSGELTLAALSARYGIVEEARQLLTLLVRELPNEVFLQAALASAESRAGLMPEAQRRCQAILQADPAFTTAYVLLARALAAQGQTEDAIQAYRQALRQDPDFAAARLELAALCRSAGRFDEELTLLEELLAASERAPSAQGLYVDPDWMLALRADQVERVRPLLARARQWTGLEEGLEPAFGLLLLIKRPAPSYEAPAQSLFLYAVDRSMLYLRVASLLDKKGDSVRALAAYYDALHVNPKLPELGSVQEAMRRLQKSGTTGLEPLSPAPLLKP